MSLMKVVQNTKLRFSAMPIDQAQKQNNALVKGSGETNGIMQNPILLHSENGCLLDYTGLEKMWKIEEFEKQYLAIKDEHHLHHNEDNSFSAQGLSFVEAYEEVGNLFLDQSKGLTTLDMGIVMDKSVVDTVFTIKSFRNRAVS